MTFYFWGKSRELSLAKNHGLLKVVSAICASLGNFESRSDEQTDKFVSFVKIMSLP